MIILIGSPGSGKSTQGQLLTDRGKLRWISMSDILRRQDLDEEHKAKMRAGELFSGPVVIDALDAELKILGDKPELILDGFPRSVDQADWLLAQQAKGRFKIRTVINLTVDKKEVEKRLTKRGREDDEIAKIDKRIKLFDQAYKPVFKVLKDNRVKILDINANQTPQAILKDIIDGLSKLGIEA